MRQGDGTDEFACPGCKPVPPRSLLNLVPDLAGCKQRWSGRRVADTEPDFSYFVRVTVSRHAEVIAGHVPLGRVGRLLNLDGDVDGPVRKDPPSAELEGHEEGTRPSATPSQIDVLYRLSPPGLSEESVPRRRRWWKEQGRGFVKWKREKSRVSEGWLRTIRQTLDDLPRKFESSGVRSAPTGPTLVRLEHLRLLRERWSLSETYLAMNLTVLREFLRWAGNSLSNEPQEWSHAKPVATRRRWLTPEQLGALMRAAAGRERVLVLLEGFNGLRRIEVLRLHVRDLSFSMPPTMRVLGTGRFGGKPRLIPMSATAYSVLTEAVRGLRQGALVYPHHPKTADRDLLAAAGRAGLRVRVSGHDLRRSFGRIAYRNGAPLVDLRNLLGHETLDMTIHYVGVDSDEMAAGLERFEQAMRASLTVPGR